MNAIYITILATFLAVLLSIWAGYRDKRKIEASRKIAALDRSEVTWQDEEIG